MRRIVLAGLLVLVLLAAACGSKQRPVVVLVLPEQGDRQWDAVHGGAAKAAAELEFTLERVTQLDPVRSVAGVIAADDVKPPEGAAFVRVGGTARDSSAPVRVVSDSMEGGRLAARRLAELLENSGDVAVIARDGDQRASSFAQELRSFPEIRLAATVRDAASETNAAAVMARLLKAHPGLRGLFVGSEAASVETVVFFQSQGQTRIRTVGTGSGLELMNALQDRSVDGLVATDPFRMGYEAVRAIDRIAKGEQVARVIQVPETLVTRDNMERPEIIEMVQPDIQKWLAPRRR